MGAIGYFLGNYIYNKPGYVEHLQEMEDNLRAVVNVQAKVDQLEHSVMHHTI